MDNVVDLQELEKSAMENCNNFVFEKNQIIKSQGDQSFTGNNKPRDRFYSINSNADSLPRNSPHVKNSFYCVPGGECPDFNPTENAKEDNRKEVIPETIQPETEEDNEEAEVISQNHRKTSCDDKVPEETGGINASDGLKNFNDIYLNPIFLV